jgi:hypothetical protein
MDPAYTKTSPLEAFARFGWDTIHQATTAITKQVRLIGIECLSGQGRGGRRVEARRFSPSSNTRSRCKEIRKEMPLG